ncbi:hypothetical protein J4221_00020 [Candidatus Pacearchaeota archaeon]|nr:hypothetical protein [Candidatus Pacearchaeota archaeon]
MKQQTKIKGRYRNVIPITFNVDYPRNIEVMVDTSKSWKIETFKPNGSYMTDADKELFMLGDERVTINGILGRVEYVKVSDDYTDNQKLRALKYERANQSI